MKVSDVIKTPVRVATITDQFDGDEPTTFYQVWADPVGMIGDRLTKEQADTIAKALDSHDALVDMVKRLRGELFRHQCDFVCGIDSDTLIREADELLKKEGE